MIKTQHEEPSRRWLGLKLFVDSLITACDQTTIVMELHKYSLKNMVVYLSSNTHLTVAKVHNVFPLVISVNGMWRIWTFRHNRKLQNTLFFHFIKTRNKSPCMWTNPTIYRFWNIWIFHQKSSKKNMNVLNI